MFMNLNCGAIQICGLNLSAMVDLARRHGFEGIDPPLDAMPLFNDPDRVAGLVRDAGLCWGSFGLPVDFHTSDESYQKTFSRLRRSAVVAQQIGCRRCVTWIMPCDDDLEYDANFERHAQRLSRAAKLLVDYNIRFGIEFVGPKTLRVTKKHPFVHTLDQCLVLCDAIGSNCGVLLDSFHWYTSYATEQDITTKLGDRIVCVHVNDAMTGRAPDQQMDHERALPCQTAVIDLASFVRGLRRIEYDGPVSTEPMIEVFAGQPADEVAARVAIAMRKMLVP